MTSTGVLRFSRDGSLYKLVVEIDPQIAAYARALVPKHLVCRPQKYAPHITVIRNECVPNFAKWAFCEGEVVTFDYDPQVQIGSSYYWLNVYCDVLTGLRLYFGLRKSYHLSRPPSGEDCFHTTVGNSKEIDNT